jgi:hypothetical protein
MADVTKVQGPSGAPESFGKKDKGSVDADKFREAMRRRVTEVTEVDPDEQKKRKRREEAEEEETVEEGPAAVPSTPISQVAPFSLEAGSKKVSPMDIQTTGSGISPTEAPGRATLPSPVSPAFLQASPSDEMADDSGMLEEDSFIETIPSPSVGESAPPPTFTETQEPPSTLPLPPQYGTQPPSPQVSEGTTPSEQPVAAGGAPSDQPETGQQIPEKKPAQPRVGSPPGKKGSVPGLEPKLAEPLKTEQQRQAGPLRTGPESKEKLTITPDMLEETEPSKVQDTTGFFEQLGKGGEGGKQGKGHAETPEALEEEAEIQGIGAPSQPSSFTRALEEKGEKKVDDKQSSLDMGALATAGVPGEPLGAAAPPPPPEVLPPYANLHPQVMEIFDRMVGVMTVMSMSGMTETVITLNAPQFASSVFFGSQIIIQEFSTAPQSFNIQLNGTPQAVALFQGNANDLVAAFQAGNYNFRVNRLETGHLTDRPLFKRKEMGGGKESDTGNQGEK